MHKSLKCSLFLGIVLSLSFSNTVLAAEGDEDETIEEVIVTGSHIRRDNFDIPSPIDVTTELDLELAGTADLGNIIFDQTYQSGVNANAVPFDGFETGADDQQWNQGQAVWANLRGLGTRATMTMMDGHRLPADTNTWGRRTGVDVNGTYPAIAIGRIETILDGASALYGAEAVGGVINIIPKKNFEGVEISYDHSQPMDTNAPTTNLSFLAGIQGERGSAIFAIELRDQERMRFTDRPDYILSAADPWIGNTYTPWWHDAGGRANPGDYHVPYRGSNGDLLSNGDWSAFPAIAHTGSWGLVGSAAAGPARNVTRTDPGCGYGFGAGHDQWTPTDREADKDPQASASAINQAGLEEFASRTSQERFENGNAIYNDLNKSGNFLNGMLHAHTNVWDGSSGCIMSLSDFQDMQAEADHNKGMAYFEYEFNDYVKVKGEIVISQNDYNTRDVTGETDELDFDTFLGAQSPYVIGHNPGNPFRAFADGSNGNPANGYLDWDDANGDGLYQYGSETGEYYVFAQDANGDGIPDRDFDGDGFADVGAQTEIGAAVVLMSATTDSDGDGVPDRFDQDTLDSGAVRLFEDVLAFGLNVNPKQPHNNNVEWLHNDGGLVYQRRFIRDDARLRLGAEIAIPDTDWLVDVDYIWSKGRRVNNYPEPILGLYVDALRCQAGKTGDQCWNPFSTTYLNTTADGQFIGDEATKFPGPDDGGWTPADAPQVNTELENRNAGITMAFNQQDLGMTIMDVVASNGNLFELPWNDQSVGFAIGVHLRLETEEWKPNASNQTGTGGGNRGLRSSEQETQAVFAEFQLPLLEHEFWGSMELQLAARYAEITTRGKLGQRGESEFTTTIPKIALRYAPTDWLSFRSSLTEGFVTPGLFALFGEPDSVGNRGSVNDYVCNNVAEIADCDGAASVNGSVFDVLIGNSPNSDLDAETSDLVNAGFSLRLLEGDMSIDIDWTRVEFNGRVEQVGASANVNSNASGFTDFLRDECPGTIPDWDNTGDLNRDPTEQAVIDGWIAADPDGIIDRMDYRAIVGPAELDCRLTATLNWVDSVANDGFGETPIGQSALVRDRGVNGLGLTFVETPWLEQGEQVTETIIYALRYSFDAEQIPLIGGNYGGFAVSASLTQMLEQSLKRYTSIGCDAPNVFNICPGDNPMAGITVDGVGNSNGTNFNGGTPGSNQLYLPLAPTPEFRLNASLRWFYGNHTAQLVGKWHDEITNINIAWDAVRERGLLSAAEALRPQEEVCSQQPSYVCGFESQWTFDVSYTYQMEDFFGTALNVNLAIRNVLDKMPTPKTLPGGFNGYLDNIMGRVGYLRLSMSL